MRPRHRNRISSSSPSSFTAFCSNRHVRGAFVPHPDWVLFLRFIGLFKARVKVFMEYFCICFTCFLTHFYNLYLYSHRISFSRIHDWFSNRVSTGYVPLEKKNSGIFNVNVRERLVSTWFNRKMPHYYQFIWQLTLLEFGSSLLIFLTVDISK